MKKPGALARKLGRSPADGKIAKPIEISEIGGGPQCPAYELVAEVVQSLLPVMEKLNIATAAEVGISTLVQRMRDEVVTLRGVVRSAGFIGAWSRKQHSD